MKMAMVYVELEPGFRDPPGNSPAMTGCSQATECLPGSRARGEDSLEARTALRCLKRIRRWRVPPRWSQREWLEEVEAETTVATLQAVRDFDPARGVPWGAFLHLRIMRGALARYRREWAYAIRRISAGAMDEYETVEGGDSRLAEVLAKSLEEALGRLPHADNALIEGLFWEGKTEAKVAEFLGISQQAVNKRKRTIFRTLRRLIENLGEGADSGL